MSLIEAARKRLSKKEIPLEIPCNLDDDLEYCHHNDKYPKETLLVGVCKYCAGDELGEHLRPLRERYERERKLEEEKADAKRLGQKWTKPKKPKSPVKPEQVWPQWYDNTAKDEIKKLTLSVLYGHSDRVIAAKRNISLTNGINIKKGVRGHLISDVALESILDPFRTILQDCLKKDCVMVVLDEFFMVIPSDWVRYPKR